MQAYRLVAHPAKPPSRVTAVEARVDASHPHWLQLRWRIDGAYALVIPPPAGRRRADELWQTTCFELFLKPEGGEAYREFNLSPSEGWNLYGFDSYRDGMRELRANRAPVCTMRPGNNFAIFDAAVPKALLPQESYTMGLSAVIEEEGGIKSYWAIAHPAADAPDFHHAACFAGRLGPPDQA